MNFDPRLNVVFSLFTQIKLNKKQKVKALFSSIPRQSINLPPFQYNTIPAACYIWSLNLWILIEWIMLSQAVATSSSPTMINGRQRRY